MTLIKVTNKLMFPKPVFTSSCHLTRSLLKIPLMIGGIQWTLPSFLKHLAPWCAFDLICYFSLVCLAGTLHWKTLEVSAWLSSLWKCISLDVLITNCMLWSNIDLKPRILPCISHLYFWTVFMSPHGCLTATPWLTSESSHISKEHEYLPIYSSSKCEYNSRFFSSPPCFLLLFFKLWILFFLKS